MPIVQISRIQHRRGLKTDLPQLAAGELGWVVDEQRLYIGNGTVADGAPAVGNTEIMTAGSSAFATALSYTYKGYLGSSTVIQTGASGDVSRTLQQTLDDHVSVKAFDAKGDNSTDDTAAIQRALDELYSDTDQDDKRARRVLFFPAGVYKTVGSLTIPPFAHLVGEGPDKSVISHGTNHVPVMVTEDDDGNTRDSGGIGSGGATTPTQIQISNLTITNAVDHGGISIDSATKVYFNNCKFEGSFTSDSNFDDSSSKGITVRSTSALPCANIYFNNCEFTKFARLVDLSFDVTNVRFHNCDFSIAYYGAIIGEQTDGSTAGLTSGPRDVQFTGCSWNNIAQQAILVKPSASVSAADINSVGPRNIISHGNYFASTVANNFEGIGTLNEVPTIQFDNDECASIMDFFERHDARRTDGSSHMNIAPEVQGIARTTDRIKQVTLANDTSTATTTGLEFAAGSGNLGKSIVLNYKIERGTTVRVGQFTISVSTNGIHHNDDYTESNGDAGVTLTAVLGRDDSSASDRSVIVKFETTATGADATMDAEATSIV